MKGGSFVLFEIWYSIKDSRGKCELQRFSYNRAPCIVIPAKAGIQGLLDPGFRRGDVKSDSCKRVNCNTTDSRREMETASLSVAPERSLWAWDINSALVRTSPCARPVSEPVAHTSAPFMSHTRSIFTPPLGNTEWRTCYITNITRPLSRSSFILHPSSFILRN